MEKMGNLTNNELDNFIQESKSIVFYKNILEPIFNNSKTKSGYNYATIGKVFTGIYLYSINPSEIIKIKDDTKMSQIEKYMFDSLIANLHTSMQTKIKNTENGKMGGAPKGNNNAKKKDNANIKINNAIKLQSEIDNLCNNYFENANIDNTIIELIKDNLITDFRNGKLYTRNELIKYIRDSL